MDKMLMNLKDYNPPIDPTDLFGKDTQRLFDACNKVMHDWLYKYDGCYIPSGRPTLFELFKTVSSSDRTARMTVCKSIQEEWNLSHPEDREKEINSRKEWERNHDKQFRIIYGIAKRHVLYLEWHGNDSVAPCGDQWTIYKDHERIARICI